MRIGIDARMLGKGFGLARYVEQLVKHLLEMDHENEYVLFLNEPLGLENDSVKEVVIDVPWYSFAEQVKMSGIIKKEKVDLIHFPHFNVPFFYNKPFVVTIHDLTMYHFSRPEATTRSKLVFWFKDKVHRLIVRHAVKKAKKIFAVSEFTRQDIHKTLGTPLDKMVVTYQAPFRDKEKEVVSKELLEKFKIIKPYVMYVGAAYPHKNLERLVEAWSTFEQEYGSDYQLVLVGKENYFYKRLMEGKAGSLDNLVYTGFVDDEDLSELYTNASLYVFPSLYEGFGLPPLEAIYNGVPVVSSSVTCLPEVLGEAALYFDPESTDQMAEVIYKGLTNEDVRLELKSNGKEILKRYSWERLAQNTLNHYKV